MWCLQEERTCFLSTYSHKGGTGLHSASPWSVQQALVAFSTAHLPSTWQKQPVASRPVANWLALLPHSRRSSGSLVWLTVCSKKTSLCGHRRLASQGCSAAEPALPGPNHPLSRRPRSSKQPPPLSSCADVLISGACETARTKTWHAYGCTPTRLAQQTNKLCGRGERGLLFTTVSPSSVSPEGRRKSDPNLTRAGCGLSRVFFFFFSEGVHPPYERKQKRDWPTTGY